MQKNRWFYTFTFTAIIINTALICMLTFWAIDDRQTLKIVQVELQELKHRIELEIKLRQELLPEIKKSAELLSRYNPELDPLTALRYAVKIWQCSDEVVNHELLTALIVIESSANHKAVSPVGALGLTQVMPFNWPNGQDDLVDPYKNIEVGATILKRYIKRYGLIGGLNAYNCGTSLGTPDGSSQRYARKVLQTAQKYF